jgi:putative endonuclease
MLASRRIRPRQSTSIDLATTPISARGNDIRRCIEREKRPKRWQRQWKFDLIERGNPDWRDMFDLLA